MAKDFDAINADKAAFQKEQSLHDLNHAQAGLNNGRIDPSGLKKSKDAIKDLEKSSRNRLSNLLNIEDYQAAWSNTIALLNEADQAVYDALTFASENLSIVRQEHDALQTQASQEKLQQAQDRYDMLYKHDLRLGEIREETEALKDTNTVEAQQRLHELSGQIHDIHMHISPRQDYTTGLNTNHASSFKAPDLGL